MHSSSFLKHLLPRARALIRSNSGCIYYERCFTNSNRENQSKGKSKFTIRSSIGVAFGVGFMYYNFYHRRSDLLDEISQHMIKFQHAFSAECASVNYFLCEEKVSARTQYNFLADVAEKTAPSVVYIEINARHPITKKTFPLSNGSGFIVKSDGLILTNAHVVSHYGHVLVKLYDGREFEGVVENLDSESDLATVRIKATDLPELPLGQSSKLRSGEFVLAMGNPLTLSHTITVGVVSSASRQGNEIGLHRKSDYIQTDAAINVGNSGGPLVNLDGEAIGINTMKATEGISFAIPSDRALDFLNRTEKKKSGSLNSSSETQKRKFLGITMLTLTPSIIQELKERISQFPGVQHGVMVWRVMVGSPSHECGIKPGDVITRINDKVINSASDIYELLAKENVLKIHIVRKETELDVEVKLFAPVV